MHVQHLIGFAQSDIPKIRATIFLKDANQEAHNLPEEDDGCPDVSEYVSIGLSAQIETGNSNRLRQTHERILEKAQSHIPVSDYILSFLSQNVDGTHVCPESCTLETETAGCNRSKVQSLQDCTKENGVLSCTVEYNCSVACVPGDPLYDFPEVVEARDAPEPTVIEAIQTAISNPEKLKQKNDSPTPKEKDASKHDKKNKKMHHSKPQKLEFRTRLEKLQSRIEKEEQLHAKEMKKEQQWKQQQRKERKQKTVQELRRLLQQLEDQPKHTPPPKQPEKMPAPKPKLPEQLTHPEKTYTSTTPWIR